MHIWIDFWLLIFFLSLIAFVLNYSNLLNFFFFSEFTWLVLYCLTLNTSILIDDLNLMSLTFFFLGFAGLEFSVGFMFLVSLKYFKLSTNLLNNQKQSDFFLKNYNNSFFIENFFWNK